MSVSLPLDPPVEDSEARRLWIGNLDPRITEFALLKLLQQHGIIEKFDLLFHRSGPLQGQPRGFAFVTYSTPSFAKIAKSNLNGKLVGSKNLNVKWAHNVKKSDLMEKQKFVTNIPALTGTKQEKKLSKIIKIQAIEAKLKTMEQASSLEFKISDKPEASTHHTLSVKSEQPKDVKLNKPSGFYRHNKKRKN